MTKIEAQGLEPGTKLVFRKYGGQKSQHTAIFVRVIDSRRIVVKMDDGSHKVRAMSTLMTMEKAKDITSNGFLYQG